MTVVSLPSCLCVCIAFVLPLAACTAARISRQSVALSARHSGPQKSRPQLEASTLYTPHSPLFPLSLSPLGTRHSHGTLRGWSILPLARHLQICAPCTLTRTHIHSECTHAAHTKTIQTMPMGSDCTTMPQEKARAKSNNKKDRDKQKVQKVKSEQSVLNNYWTGETDTEWISELV